MKSRYWCLTILIAAGIGFALFNSRRLERRDPEMIRRYFLKKTPLGIPRDEALTRLRAAGLRPRRAHTNSVIVVLGDYFSLPMFKTMVVGEWTFSESNRLEHIEIRKSVDGP
jgi:hypothetical protein